MKHAKQTRAPWILLACLAAIALCIVAAVTLLQPNTNPKNIEIPGTRGNIPATIQLPAKSARGEELPLVVLCHGFTGNRQGDGHFVPLAEDLAVHGIATVRLDFAGCGDSTEPYANYTLANMAADVDSVIGYMQATYGTGKTALVGHSMGGRLASLYPQLGQYPVTALALWSPANGTVLCLNGYGISMAGNGPVIEVQPGVTFTLCDCNGSQNQYIHGITHASSSNGRGAGVLVGQSATTKDTAGTNTAVFNMYGGAIYNNYPWPASGENAASASGVLIGGGTFNMYGGKITGNKLTEDGGIGGGVFVANQGSFYMSGGEISGNTAKEGGGVFVGGLYGYHDFYASAGGTFTMSGGSITGNSGTGGGVYVSNKGTFTVSGNVNITGNKAGDKTSNNVYLGEYKGQSNTIIVNGTLDSTASIGVSVETANQVVAENISAENAKRFTSDNKKYSLKYDSTSQTLTLVGHDNHPVCGETCTHGNKHDVITNWRSISTEAELNAVIMGGYYYLTQDVEIKNPWSPANGVTLCLNGHSITLVGYDKSSVIKVESGTFTLCDCSGGKGKITHGYKTGSKIKYTGRGVSVYGGMFTMYGGSITGNDYNYSGGGVHVTNATFNMYGGSITGNTSSPAGGVYVGENGTFNMKGGEITGNTSSSYGA